MELQIWPGIIEEMKKQGISFSPGLTDSEIAGTESRFGFRFPPDLRAFLQTALPEGEKFPNWRSGAEKDLRGRLEIPKEGILFDIEHNGLWLEEWGPKPPTLEEACRTAGGLVSDAPKLIPIFIHRMIPDEPHAPGNPVFSVHQTDIIVYGLDLANYLRCEFKLSGAGVPESAEARAIRFWDIDRFQNVRWAAGPCEFDNRKGQLP